MVNNFGVFDRSIGVLKIIKMRVELIMEFRCRSNTTISCKNGFINNNKFINLLALLIYICAKRILIIYFSVLF